MRRSVGVWFVGLTFLGAACSAENSSAESEATAASTAVETTPASTTTVSPTTTVAPTTTIPGADRAFDYFDAFGEDSSVGYARMRDLAVPASPAWDYYFHQERLFIASNQVGAASTPAAVKIDGDDIVSCDDAACAADTRYSDFEFRGDLLYSFSVEGREVGRLISTYPTSDKYWFCWSTDNAECGSDKSIDIILRSIYRTANNDVYITFDWKRGVNATGELRYDQTTINGQIQPTTYLEGGGRTFVCSGWATPVPEPGGFNVGYFSFTDPPLNTPFKLSIVMRWDGEETAYDFDLGAI